jgi:hypothetical protein
MMTAVKDFLQLRRVFVTILFIGTFTLATRNVVDPDVWWHLKTGEYIAVHKSIPHVDIFSFTRAGQPWIAHEWLSDVLLYGIYRAASWGGLIAVFAAVVSAAFFFLYLRAVSVSRSRCSIYIAGLFALLAAFATAPLWGVRPQILSLLLTSLWLLLLERSEQNRRLLWWTLPLTLLWVNLHAGFALGLALLALFLAGEWLERILDWPAARESSARLRTLAITLFLDLMLVPLNPNGTKMYFYPFETLRSQAMQKYIAEWASPDFHHAEYAPLLFLLLITIALLAWCSVRPRPRDLLLLLVGTVSALTSIRLLPLFVLVAVPIAARSAQSIFVKRGLAQASTYPLNFEHPVPQRPLTPVWNALILIAALLFSAINLFQVTRRQLRVEADRFPAGAVAYLATQPNAGPIFNHYDWGGYLIWKLHPQAPVFIDGRADVYGEPLFNQFANTYQLKNNWQKTLAEWQIRAVLVPPSSALAQALRHEPNWSVRYEDPQSVLFTIFRQTPQPPSPEALSQAKSAI